MRSRLWLVLILACVLFAPKLAYAQEEREIARTEVMEQTDRGLLGATPATPMSLIRGFCTGVKFQFFGANKNFTNLHTLLASFFGAASMKRIFFNLVITLVVGWWFVRKVIRMLFRAFRRGKANV